MTANTNSIVQHATQIENGVMKQTRIKIYKNYRACKKGYNWNPSLCVFENCKYLKIVVNYPKSVCSEIIYIMDIVSTNVTIIISAKVTSTILTNSDDTQARSKMDCYILHTALLVIILLFIIANICYQYAEHRQNKKVLMQ